MLILPVVDFSSDKTGFFRIFASEYVYKKMRSKRHISLVICLLISFAAVAQSHGKTMLSLVHENDSTIRLRFEGDHLQLFVDSTAAKGYSLLRWEGMTFGTGPAGAPDLPLLSTLVRLPKGSTLELADIDSLSQFYWHKAVPRGKPVAPVTEGWAKDRPRPEYRPDDKIYNSWSTYRCREKITVEDLGVMGTEQLFRVTVHPVAYMPLGREVDIDTYIEATLKVKETRSNVNHGNERFLIVSRPQFREGLQPFVQWKRQEGYDVVELYADTHLSDSVKALMRPLFDSSDPLSPIPTYTLLVGDNDQIESPYSTIAFDGVRHITDLFYADFTGDYLPETMLGRWPVNDSAELQAVVEKTLRYEQCRNMDTLQMKRLLFVAGEESSGIAPTSTNGQVNYLKREAKLAHPELDTLCWYNPASGSQLEAIQSAIGDGGALLSYTAHCTRNGWTAPALTSSGVEEAGATQPTVFVNNCCQSNAFAGTCFGEELLRMPQGGAAGVIGATNNTLWQEDYYWAVGPRSSISLDTPYDSLYPGAFDGLTGRRHDVTTMGELLTAGNLAVTAIGSSYSKFYWEIYCLFGDPSLRPWIGVPQEITLTTDSLFNGQSELHVSGTPGVTVTALQGDSLLGHAVIDTAGGAVVPLCRTLDTLPLIVTATGVGLRPHIDTLTVEATMNRGVTLRDVVVDDTAVRCTVMNIGQQRLDSLRVALVQDATDGAVLEEQLVVIDSLLPNCQREVTLPITIVEVGQLPIWQAALVAWSDDTECRLTLSHRLPVTYPTLALRLLEADSSEALSVSRNHDYLLEAVVDGQYDSLRVTVTAYPTGDTLVSPTHPLATTHSSFSTPDSLCALHIEGDLHLGHWRQQQDFWLEGGDRIESFENAFNSHPWKNNGWKPWTIDSSEHRSGTFSVRSGAISHSQTTCLCLEATLAHADSLSYWVKTSTEAEYDKFFFQLDGRARGYSDWGETAWRQFRHTLTAGHHTLCWCYAKDNSGSAGHDCVWVDDIQLPLALWDSLYAWSCDEDTTTVGIGSLPPYINHTSLTLYPNPAGDAVWLTAETAMTVTVNDMLGRRVATFHLTPGVPVRWDIHALPRGCYFATGDNVTKIIIH